MTHSQAHDTKHPLLHRRSHSLSPDRIPHLKAALEGGKVQIEADRQILRLKMAEVEWELNRLTSQQAELQKLQVAIDHLLRYLSENESPENTGLNPARFTGLADARVSGTC